MSTSEFAQYVEAFRSLQEAVPAIHPDLAAPYRRLLAVFSAKAPEDEVLEASSDLNRTYRAACYVVVEQNALGIPTEDFLYRVLGTLGTPNAEGARRIRIALLAYQAATA